jgi:hypothetical protein
MADTKNDSAATEKPIPRFKVVSSHALDQGRVLFSTVSEKRARAFIQNRFPRGEEAHLVTPDGKTESYQHERTGPHGEDVEQWQPFDAAAWRPPQEQPPPGETAWQDVEA